MQSTNENQTRPCQRAARQLMKVILMIKVLAASAVALSALLTSFSALAAEHEVKMLN